jgi:hypothetical protein
MKTERRPARNNREIGAGLILAATLLGWRPPDGGSRRRERKPDVRPAIHAIRSFAFDRGPLGPAVPAVPKQH